MPGFRPVWPTSVRLCTRFDYCPVIISANLNRTFKVALKPLHIIFKTLHKVASYHADYNSIIQNRGSQSSFLSYIRLKLTLRVFLACHIVAMVICYINRMTAICLPMIGNSYDTIIVASLVKQW